MKNIKMPWKIFYHVVHEKVGDCLVFFRKRLIQSCMSRSEICTMGANINSEAVIQ